MPLKLNTGLGGGVTLQGANTATDVTVTVPATSGGTVAVADVSGNVAISGNADITGKIGLGGANYGTSGQVLTSQGSSAAPVWADAKSMTLLGTLTTTSGTTQTLSGLDLTGYRYLAIVVNTQQSAGAARSLLINSLVASAAASSATRLRGLIFLELTTGMSASLANDSTATGLTVVTALTSITNASTSIPFAWSSSATFSGGVITVYGVK